MSDAPLAIDDDPHRPPSPPGRRKRRWFWPVLIVALVAGAGLLCVGVIALAVVGSQLASQQPPLLVQEVEAGSGERRILQIDLRGVISGEGDSSPFAGPAMVPAIRRQLRAAVEDERIAGVLLVIDSPGGGVTASDVLHHELQELRRSGKELVVHMGAVCASGGMYLAAAADEVIALPTSITGSIGVIMTHVDASELLDQHLGIHNQAIKSGPLKDIGSMSRPMQPAERDLLQSIVDQLYDRFLTVVAEGRAGKAGVPGELDDARSYLRPIADGRILTAIEAHAAGLIDAIGYRDDAIARIRERCELPNAPVIRYQSPGGLAELFGAQDRELRLRTGFDDLVPRLRASGFAYLWSPGK